MISDSAEKALHGSVLVPKGVGRTVENRPLRLGEVAVSYWNSSNTSSYGNMAVHIFEKPFIEEAEDPNAEVWSFLESIEDGWDEGEGKAPSREGLRWLRNSYLVLLLRLHVDASPPFNIKMEGPAVFPLASGEVEFAWEENERSASLKVDLDTRQGRLHLFDTATFESKHSDYYFSSGDSVWEIVSEVYSHLVSE